MTYAVHEWAPGLAASATYHPRELARQPHRAPRFLDEQSSPGSSTTTRSTGSRT